MRGAPPPEPPRGGRPGQSGRFPGTLGGAQGQQGQRGAFGAPPRPSGTGWRAGPGGPSGANWGATPGGGFAPGGLGPSGHRPAIGPGGPWTSARMAATGMRIPATGMSPAVSKHGHLRFAMFHDGNPGHIWRGEFASMLGESIIATGLVMWLAYLTASPDVVAIALVALGLPFLIAGPLAAPFTRKEEPGGLLRLVGWLRVLLMLGLIGMHYLTILPVVYLLLFGISLCGRLRTALRVAALRGCLAPGEPERVAAATHFGAVVVAVIGPLLASLLFILAGQRILLLAGVSALVFLLSASSDSLLSALPNARRAFLLARPEPEHDASPDVDSADDDDEDAYDDDLDDERDGDGDDPATASRRREAALPEWQQWGPGSVGQAMADVFGGFRLAGSAPLSYGAMRILAAIALVGGGLGMLEVFYITDHLLQPTYYLGALLAAEGAGLALGAMLWSDLGRRASGTAAMFLGTIGIGVALGALAMATALPMVILLALGLGVANAVAVEGAREALRAGFDGVERRALAAGETAVTAFCGLVGAILFDLLLRGFALGGHGGRGGTPAISLPPLNAAQLILDAGIGLVLAGTLSIFLVAFGGMRARGRARRAAARAERRGRGPDRLPNLEDDEEWDDDASREYTAWGESYDDSRYVPAADDSRYMTGYTGSTSARWDDDDYGASSTYDNPRGGRGRR